MYLFLLLFRLLRSVIFPIVRLIPVLLLMYLFLFFSGAFFYAFNHGYGAVLHPLAMGMPGITILYLLHSIGWFIREPNNLTFLIGIRLVCAFCLSLCISGIVVAIWDNVVGRRLRAIIKYPDQGVI